jgi:hypothetical protein
MSNAQINGDYLGFGSPEHFNDQSPNAGIVVINTGALKTTESGSSFGFTLKNSY